MQNQFLSLETIKCTCIATVSGVVAIKNKLLKWLLKHEYANYPSSK